MQLENITSLITKATLPVAAQIFIDDTDLYLFSWGTDTIEEVVTRAQPLLDI